MLTPRGHASLDPAAFSEDETHKDVEATDREQEKGRDERKVVDVVREYGRTESLRPHDLVSRRTTIIGRRSGLTGIPWRPMGPGQIRNQARGKTG